MSAHQAEAEFRLEAARRSGDWAEARANLAEAQVEALLAVADELRTANLMRHLQFMVTGLSGPQLSPSDQAECERIGKDIRTRLGLTS